MQSHSVYKIPHGKLLKISMDYDRETKTIKTINITGDFFVYPEETIEKVEEQLVGTMVERNHLLKKIQSIIDQYNIECIGVDAEGLTEGILLCVV